MSIRQVFLGGTTSKNPWRKLCIARMTALGFSPDRFFDPVVEHWTKEHQAREDALKKDPSVLKVFYLGDAGREDGTFLSFYSLHEATIGLYDAPSETAVIFDVTGLAPRAAKRLLKVHADLRGRFPEAPIFTSVEEFERWLVKMLIE